METDSPEVGLLRVRSTTNPQSLASAIVKSIFDSHTYPTLRAIGHGAVGQAVKGIAIARGLTAARGVDLAVLPGFETVPGSNGGGPISAVTLKLIER